jgi:hypothetical protein
MQLGEYTCEFLLYTGEICGRTCMKAEGCCFHKNAIKRFPCTDCGKPTRSGSGRCPDHIRSYYVGRHYQKYYKKKRNSVLGSL